MNVVASITTTGRRIGRVMPAIKSVLAGTLRPDRIILWLNSEGSSVAPPVRREDIPAELASLPVDVKWCENYGPATKLLPAMIAYPNDYIATFDDDILYPPGWLEGLARGAEEYPGSIVCYRARLIVPGRPYAEWRLVKGRHVSSRDLLPTGVHGVIYSPRCLKQEAFDIDKLRELAWANDDLWFAATRATDAVVIPMAEKFRGSGMRGPRLSRRNLRGRNDQIIRALAEHFGNQVPWINPDKREG